MKLGGSGDTSRMCLRCGVGCVLPCLGFRIPVRGLPWGGRVSHRMGHAILLLCRWLKCIWVYIKCFCAGLGKQGKAPQPQRRAQMQAPCTNNSKSFFVFG